MKKLEIGNDGIIILAFNGTGKSYFKQLFSKNKIVDLDSMLFFKKEGWEYDYVKKALEYMRNNYIVLLTTYDSVRRVLQEFKIDYSLVYPSRHLKDKYLSTFINRKNNPDFIKNISANWDTYMDSLENDSSSNHYVLNENEYLADITVLKDDKENIKMPH